jgi:CHAD domain-containing protein
MRGMPNPRWDQEHDAAENAARELPRLARAYFAYVRRELAKDPDPPRLHRLRLATKRLRYTVELFRPLYSRGLEARLAALRKVQQRLGHVNDAVASWTLLDGKLPKRSRHRTHMEKYLHARAAKEAKAFRKEWKEEFEAPGREEWWVSFLASPVRSRT